ncbi:MAG: DUF362 domain-containing protein [Candidatus Competibacteraceae bacterium]|nr:DUF362 domain-containing protein [Candidatus Competibacteraceae bacterium]
MFEKLNINIVGGLNIPLPRMLKVRQVFADRAIKDVTAAVQAELNKPEISARITPGASIAIGVGSRGVANIDTVVKAMVAELKKRGAQPFVFPAMGSHGGATADGQAEVLANYGITEATIGAPVRATMDTEIVTQLPDGTPLHMDKFARAADGVVVVNRIKPHTTFRGDIESGLVKMLIIGMGKINGASTFHTLHGMDRFPEVLPQAAEALMEHIPFLFGLGLVEDAYDHTAIIEAITGDKLVEREAQLLVKSKDYMAKLYFDNIDVLIIDQMGKEISGAGFDPNITGRNNRGVVGFDHPQVKKIVVLDLSDKTHGNATGLGVADVITQRLFNRIDFEYTYANVITSAYLDGGLIPIVMQTEHDAIALAAKTVPRVNSQNARIVRIRDTLTLGEIEVSEALLDEVQAHAGLEILSEPFEMAFDADGRLPR